MFLTVMRRKTDAECGKHKTETCTQYLERASGLEPKHRLNGTKWYKSTFPEHKQNTWEKNLIFKKGDLINDWHAGITHADNHLSEFRQVCFYKL